MRFVLFGTDNYDHSTPDTAFVGVYETKEEALKAAEGCITQWLYLLDTQSKKWDSWLSGKGVHL